MSLTLFIVRALDWLSTELKWIADKMYDQWYHKNECEKCLGKESH